MNDTQSQRKPEKAADQPWDPPPKDKADFPLTLTEDEMTQMLDNFKQMVKTGVIEKTPFELEE